MRKSAILDPPETIPGTDPDMFRLAVEASRCGMVVIAADGRIALVNSQIEQLFGYRREELVGRVIEILIPQRLRAAHARRRREFFDHARVRKMGGGVEIVGLRKDGSELPLEICLNPFESRGRRYALGCVLDMTERRAIAAMRFKSEMASWVSHEFNNALAVLTTSSHVLRDGEPKKVDRDRLTAYDIMNTMLRRLKETVANFLNYAKLESGMLVISERPTPIGHLIQETLLMLRPLAKHKNLRVTARVPPAIDDAKADPVAISLVIANLISNAIKFTPDGGSISVILAKAGHRNLEVAVKDTGIGIEPKDLAAIRDGRFREGKGGKDGEGFGLGLRISQKLLQSHGSELQIDSAPGKGSRFNFRLPVWRA